MCSCTARAATCASRSGSCNKDAGENRRQEKGATQSMMQTDELSFSGLSSQHQHAALWVEMSDNEKQEDRAQKNLACKTCGATVDWCQPMAMWSAPACGIVG